MRIWFDSAGLKTLRIYIWERERERERVRISSGVEKLRWPVGLPLNFPLPIFQSWSTEQRERERESACVSAETGSASGFEHSIFSSTYCKSWKASGLKTPWYLLDLPGSCLSFYSSCSTCYLFVMHSKNIMYT